MSFSRAFQWYHSHLDPIWPDGTFKASNYEHTEWKLQQVTRDILIGMIKLSEVYNTQNCLAAHMDNGEV